MKNWKTTATGMGGLIVAVGDIIHSFGTGAVPNWTMDMPLIVAGVTGLLAKDYNVSGK